MSKQAKKHLQLKTYDEDLIAAYLELADHPHQLVTGIVDKTVRINDLIPNLIDPELILEFDASGKAIGIEILYPYNEFYDEEEE